MKDNYYRNGLNSQKLFKVYDTRIERVRNYLDSEIEYVRETLQGTETVLELGAGYGRIIKELAPYTQSITGIDISEDSVAFGKEYFKDITNAEIITMDVHNITLNNHYDVVLCLQNGLSSMKLTTNDIKRIMEFVKDGGKVFFSSYREKFWDVRLQWFQEQANKELLGEVDMEKTKDGVVVCKDGFIATTSSSDDLKNIGETLGYPYEIIKVDESSIFLIINK